MIEKFSVQDCVLFITGANRPFGIGRALMLEALQRGAKKVYAAARDITQLDSLVVEFPGKIIPIKLDITNTQQIKDAVAQAKDTQVLINNAGAVGMTGCVQNFDDAMARQEMEVNFFGPLHLIHAFMPHLSKHAPSAIVNIISIGGLYPSPMHVTYSASKAAFYSLTQALRIEMKMLGQHTPVFGVYPGPIDTDMAQGLAVNKETPANLALRVFDGMQEGRLDITTDVISDHFASFLKKDPATIAAIKQAFSQS